MGLKTNHKLIGLKKEGEGMERGWIETGKERQGRPWRENNSKEL